MACRASARIRHLNTGMVDRSVSMNSALQQLHQTLASLGRQRRWIRWGTAYSALCLTLLLTLAAVCLVDILFEMDVLQRLTVLAMAVTAVVWAVVRFVRPHLGVRESELDLALIVEKENGIDSDLVAAIEFAAPAAPAWGSRELQQAVIDAADSRGRNLHIRQAMDRTMLVHRCQWLTVVVLVCGTGIVAFPEHVAIFLRRVVLGSDHYPTSTVVNRIEINGHVVLAGADQSSPRTTRVAENRAVEFRVLCARRPSAFGEVVVWEAGSRQKRRVRLHRVLRQREPAPGTSAPTWYTARLPALMGVLHYEVYLGDAWTNRATIDMIPLPKVELCIVVEPPAYVESDRRGEVVLGQSRVTVREGSRVELGVQSVNGKRLQSAWAQVRTSDATLRYELRCADNQGLLWSLPSGHAPALDEVLSQIEFEIHVSDADGLQPVQAPGGLVRVQVDAPPDCLAKTLHRVVLPAATPSVEYRLNDDLGVGQVRLEVQVERQRHAAIDTTKESTTREVYWVTPSDLRLPLRRIGCPSPGNVSSICSPGIWRRETNCV